MLASMPTVAITCAIAQPIKPGCDSLPRRNACHVAGLGQRTNPLGDMRVRARAVLTQHVRGTGPQFPVTHHSHPIAQLRRGLAPDR